MSKKKSPKKPKVYTDGDPNWMNHVRKILDAQVKKDEARLPKR